MSNVLSPSAHFFPFYPKKYLFFIFLDFIVYFILAFLIYFLCFEKLIAVFLFSKKLNTRRQSVYINFYPLILLTFNRYVV